MEALGTTDREFAEGFVRQLVRAAGKYDIDDLLFRLAVMRGAKPRDPLESMLLAQMGAVHDAIIRIAGQLAGAETLHHQDCAARAINQLARTYASQLEELKRWRSGDDAKVTVQNLPLVTGPRPSSATLTIPRREAWQKRLKRRHLRMPGSHCWSLSANRKNSWLRYGERLKRDDLPAVLER
jgi:hypothetical protein